MWETVKTCFAWDGTLRDLYVLNTTIDDWQRWVDWLRHSEYPLSFSLDGQPAALPVDVAWILQNRDEIGALLSIDVHGIRLNCHFFWDKDIELDLHPRDVQDEQRFTSLLEFIRAIGVALNKEVRLTEENVEEAVILASLRLYGHMA